MQSTFERSSKAKKTADSKTCGLFLLVEFKVASGVVRVEFYSRNDKVITGLKRISKPGLRVYAGKDELPRVLGGLGIAIISTNQGVVTDKKARELQVGGEVLAFIW